MFVHRKFAHHVWAFDQDNNDLLSQIKSSHQTIGMRTLKVYFSLEGRQANTKKFESKEVKGKRRKARFFLTRLVTYYLCDNELAICTFMFGLHWTLEPWLSECVQFKTKHSRKRKKITNKKTTSISRIVNVLDTYQKIIFTVSRKAI